MPQFTGWPLLGTSKPRTGGNILQIILYLLLGDPGWAQAAADLGLHQTPSQEGLKPTPLAAGFRSHQSTTEPVPHTTHPKGGLIRHQSPT